MTTVELSKFSLTKTMSSTYDIYRSNISPFLKISALISSALLLLDLVFVRPKLIMSPADLLTSPEKLHSLPFNMFVYIILTLAITSFGAGAMIKATTDIYVGNEVNNIQNYLKFSLRRFGTMYMTAILAFLGTFVGTMLFIVPGIILMMGWMLYEPPIIIENKNNTSVFRALSRSWTLTSGFRCGVFATLLILVVPTFMSAALSSTLFGGMHTVLGTIVNRVLSTLVIPIVPIGKTVIYISLRVEKESPEFNFDSLVNEVGVVGLVSSGGDDEMSVPLAALDSDDHVEYSPMSENA